MIFEEIISPQNPKIKEIVALKEKSKLRRDKSLFIVEGAREVIACLNNGFEIETLLFDPEITGENLSGYQNILDALKKNPCKKLISLSNAAYSKIAYRESTEGIISIVREKTLELRNLKTNNSAPLVLVCETIEKPGNIGALLRTADACDIDAVLLCNSLTDLYNPNLIRASLGAIFTRQIVICSNEEAYEWLKQKNCRIITAQLQDSEYYYRTNMNDACAIVVGNEAVGLSDFWRKVSDAKIKIPMHGELDSLNVSVSAAVLCYEAIRQRENKKKFD